MTTDSGHTWTLPPAEAFQADMARQADKLASGDVPFEPSLTGVVQPEVPKCLHNVAQVTRNPTGLWICQCGATSLNRGRHWING